METSILAIIVTYIVLLDGPERIFLELIPGHVVIGLS
jgi:hypothetical protein